MEEDKVILGGGVAGLIWLYYHPEYKLISKDVGGQFKSAFALGPKFLHLDENTKKLMTDLGLSNIPIKKVKIGFHYNGKVHSENTEENRQRYFNKTRESNEPYRSSMSANKTSFEAYDIGPEELTNLLFDNVKKNNIIRQNAKKIDIENQEIEIETEKIKYNNLLSTIPANIFLRLSGENDLAEKFKYFSTFFVLFGEEDFKYFYPVDFTGFDYVYFSEDKFPFHRATKTSQGIVAEYKVSPEQNEPILLGVPIRRNDMLLKVGQLVENDVNLNFKNVRFFGRYATWKHSIKINELLKEVYGTI